MAELSDFLDGEIEQPDWLKEMKGNPILTYQHNTEQISKNLAIYCMDNKNQLWFFHFMDMGFDIDILPVENQKGLMAMINSVNTIMKINIFRYQKDIKVSLTK